MDLLGHVGITVGLGEVLEATLDKAGERGATRLTVDRGAWGRVDYRLLLVSSLLPDTIDKPLGAVILADTLSNGRTFSHTLLSAVVLCLSGGYLHLRRGQLWVATLAGAAATHLVLDEMWRNPLTSLWPFHGQGFARGNASGLPVALPRSLLTDRHHYVPEIVGGLRLVCLALMMVLGRRVRAFIRTGRITPG